MSPEILAILMFLSVLILIFLGHPLGFVLGFSGVAWGLVLLGPSCLPIFASRVYGVMDTFVLVAVPLFIFMANILEQSGLAGRLFDAMRLLMGPLRGGMAMAVVVVCAAFAACTGIIGASVVTMGLLALPAMVKRGYGKELASGTVAAGGCLGILIPPSIMLVIMGQQAALSVGKLFMGAVGPGVILAALYIVYIGIRCYRKPEEGPAMSPEERAKTRIRTRLRVGLVDLVPVVLLIVGVLGTIFAGIATPTEAAAVGALISFLLVLAYRRFTWQGLRTAVISTAKTTSMVMIILVGAACFTATFLGMGGGPAITNMLVGLGLGKWGTFAIMMLMLIIMGMFIDYIGIIMITFPIFLPVAAYFGFDPLWFVVIMAVNLQASFLTPPFGYALFYLKGILPEGVSMGNLIRGVIPFVVLIAVGIAICTLVPSAVTWLPGLMIK